MKYRRVKRYRNMYSPVCNQRFAGLVHEMDWWASTDEVVATILQWARIFGIKINALVELLTTAQTKPRCALNMSCLGDHHASAVSFLLALVFDNPVAEDGCPPGSAVISALKEV